MKLKKKKKIYSRPVVKKEDVKPKRSRQFLDAASILKPEMIPYLFWSEWKKALDRGDFHFMWDMSAEGSNAQKLFGKKEDFFAVCQKKLRPLPGLHNAMLQKIRLNGTDEAHIIQIVGHNDRSRDNYIAERWYLLRSKIGWRIHQVDTISLPFPFQPKTISVDLFPVIQSSNDYATALLTNLNHNK